MECSESVSWETLSQHSVSTGELTVFLLFPAFPPFEIPAQKISLATLDTSSPLHLHKTARSTPLLKQLQWLPTTAKSKFKFLNLTFKIQATSNLTLQTFQMRSLLWVPLLSCLSSRHGLWK